MNYATGDPRVRFRVDRRRHKSEDRAENNAPFLQRPERVQPPDILCLPRSSWSPAPFGLGM
eukprot:3787316-Lingulodinium_polyedra.AAC.1